MVKEFLIGDNPFIGVSHLAQTKAREEKKEASLKNKVSVIEAGVECGATGFTFSTHESNLELLKYMHSNRRDLLERLNYYILVPYAQGYVRKANTLGTIGLIKTLLSDVVRKQLTNFLLALLTMRIDKVMSLFIGHELSPYLETLPKHRVKAVLLHEVLTELIMAYDLSELLREIKRYVETELGTGFGLETRNIGHLCGYLENKDLSIEYIMTPMNPLGYQMAPSKEEAEKCIVRLADEGTRIIAINILASGAVSLEEAMVYLSRFKGSIFAVTSASTKARRICQNFRRLQTLRR